MRQTMRQVSARFVAFFATFCMVMAMMPAMAFADTYTITATQALKNVPITIEQGASINLNDYLNGDPVFTVYNQNNEDVTQSYLQAYGTPTSHYDFVAPTGTTCLSVNKHSGVLTTGTVTGDSETVNVTVYVMEGTAPTGNNGKPCNGLTQYGTATISITVTANNTYTYQGNSMTMKMTSPTVTSYSGSNSTGWVNSFSSISAANDGYYYFTVKLSSGFQTYNTPASFAEWNDGNIILTNSAGTIATLTEDNDTAVQIYSTDHSTKTVQVRVLASAVTGSNVQLVFQTGFHGNNANNTLGCPVAFVIV